MRMRSPALCAVPALLHAGRGCRPRSRPVDLYIAAFAELERHEFAALGLTLGIVLLRGRERGAAGPHPAARGAKRKLFPRADRLAHRRYRSRHALLLSEPQIVVAWAAASDEPDIIGDIGIVTPATMSNAFWLSGRGCRRTWRNAIERAVDALRASGESFTHGADHAWRASGRGGRPRHRRTRGDAVARCQRGLRKELNELKSAAPRHAERHRVAPHADRRPALSGLGARPRWRG